MTQTISSAELELCRQVPLLTLLNVADRGRRVMVKCPFHADRTASLAIYPNNGFHCFGCGAHGKNAVDFVMRLSNKTSEAEQFKEALQELKQYI